MTGSEIRHLEQWLQKAEHDLIAAKLIIDIQPLILDIACFHCQQAVEKYLKAYLVFKKQDFPKTHNLDLLLKNCIDFDAAFEGIDLLNLEDFAVRGRYPHDFIMPTFDETSSFYQIAVDVKLLVHEHIGLK
ncbi:MAG: DNA-binding protein [Flavipsychrobacter sp.]|jgi:HEPN domain-containing protein|nr:DNA-binding protein [Flavipsychrobacter sp.]